MPNPGQTMHLPRAHAQYLSSWVMKMVDLEVVASRLSFHELSIASLLNK